MENSYRPTTNTLEESEFRQAMSGLRRIGLVASALVLSIGFLGGNVRAEGISTGQQATDQLFYLVLVPAIGIGILVMGLVAYAVLKFRVRKGHTEGPTNPRPTTAASRRCGPSSRRSSWSSSGSRRSRRSSR